MKRLLVAISLLFVSMLALGQTYPSPTYNNVAINGVATIPNAAITGGTITGLSNPIPLSSGGTNATSASAALANLGGLPLAGGTLTGPLTAPSLSVMGTATLPSVAITGGTITGLSAPVPVASGGTGATTQSAALTALLGSSVVPVGNGGTGLSVSAATGVDVRLYGAPTDGVTDGGAAINSCLAANSICVIPPTQNGIFISTPVMIPAGKWLIGTASSAENTAPSFQYPGVSWLTCSASLSGACVTWGTANTLKSGGVKNLTIAGQAGTPKAGQKGLVFAGGYNVRMENVSVANFDTCIEFDQGISGQGVNNYAQSCGTHYWVFNTWPEFSQVGGRSGANGSGNYNTAQDDVYFTSSLGSGGVGPNSIEFVNYKFENDHTACAFRWGGNTVTPGEGYYRFVNIYKEPMPSGSVLCSDNTQPSITGLTIQNSYISQDTGSADFSSGLNAATELARWNIIGNQIYLSSATFAPTATGTYGFLDVNFRDNWMPPTTLTPGGGGVRNDKLTSIGNFYNGTTGAGLTLNQGAYGWQQLTSEDQGNGGITNNTDGNNQTISWPNAGITMSGPLTLGGALTMKAGPSVSYSTPTLAINDTNGSQAATLMFKSNGTNYWDVDKSGGNNFRIARYLSGTYTDNPISITNATGVVTIADGLQLPVTTVAALPTCGGTQKGMQYAVSDASAPTYNGTLTGGGSLTVPVFCNGSAWTAH